MKRLLLIDTFNYIHRAFHAFPKTFKDKEGNPTNAIYGFTSMLISTLDMAKPTHVIAAIDEKDEKLNRKKMFEAYKAHRKELDPDLASQIPKIKDILTAFGITQVFKSGYEADDVIGSVAKKAASEDFDVVIVSKDADITQLLGIDGNVKLFFPDAKDGQVYFGKPEFIKKNGFEPVNLCDYKALRGDTSDNIPGVKGIGDKTAKELVLAFKDLDTIYKNIPKIKVESVRNKLNRDKEMAYLSKTLATIITDLELEIELDASKIKSSDRLKVLEVLKKYNFKSLIRKLGFEPEDSAPGVNKNKKSTPADKSQLQMF